MLSVPVPVIWSDRRADIQADLRHNHIKCMLLGTFAFGNSVKKQLHVQNPSAKQWTLKKIRGSLV